MVALACGAVVVDGFRSEGRLARHPLILESLADAIEGKALLWRVTLTEFARWWRWRVARSWSMVSDRRVDWRDTLSFLNRSPMRSKERPCSGASRSPSLPDGGAGVWRGRGRWFPIGGSTGATPSHS